MKRLLDTHVLLEILRSTLNEQASEFERYLRHETEVVYASTCSLWEIAIKVRLGKLEIGLPLSMLAGYFEALGMSILPIDRHHAVAVAEPEPPTRDPFDRMLLAQCHVEKAQLVTIDHALLHHPLARRREGR